MEKKTATNGEQVLAGARLIIAYFESGRGEYREEVVQQEMAEIRGCGKKYGEFINDQVLGMIMIASLWENLGKAYSQSIAALYKFRSMAN